MSNCHGHFTVICNHESLGSGLAIDAECGTWDCEHCAAKLRDKWMQHAERMFSDAGLWEHSIIHGADAFDALTRRLRRHGRNYIRVRVGDVSHVFHQALLGHRQYIPDSSRWLNVKLVTAKFREVLFGNQVSRVSSTREFKLPREPERGPWRRVGIRRRSVKQLDSWLYSLGVEERIHARKAFSGELVPILLLTGFPAVPLLPASCPSLSTQAADVVGRHRETRTTDPPVTLEVAPERDERRLERASWYADAIG